MSTQISTDQKNQHQFESSHHRTAAPRRVFRRMMERVLVFLSVLFFAVTTGCSANEPDDPITLDALSNQVVIDWNMIAHEAAQNKDKHANGLDVVRILSIMHIAQHDALNAIAPAFRTYAMNEMDAEADPIAAAASAAHDVLAAIYPDQQSFFDQKMAQSLEKVAEGDAQNRGIALGKKAASAILANRAKDGSDTGFIGDYKPQPGAGKYQFTPPYEFAVLPGWRFVKTFGLNRADQFRPGPQPSVDSDAYVTAFNEVKTFGSRNSSMRTEDQTRYAKFWYEFSEIGWNRIGRVVAADKGLGLQSTARMFALLNMVMSDAYVAGWDAKFHYDFWRPVSAIRSADADGNDATEMDAAWEPLLQTPPVQDYPSTHSALGNAAAAVLASVFGDKTTFTFTSPTADPVHPSRTFQSFSQAADENADSRVMAGIHFRFACETGLELGKNVGEWAVNNHLQRY